MITIIITAHTSRINRITSSLETTPTIRIAIIKVTKIKVTTLEDAWRIVIKVRRLKVLVTRAVSQDEVVVEAEDVEVHVEVVDEEEEMVEVVEEDELDNMWMKCLLMKQTTMRKNMTIDMMKMGFL